ncbi:putative zinc-binding metallopeptidase [Bacteroides sp. ET71]|uniref:zinc-binding metallopeptidase n=1 Tax=Bacteroides sp. ET71 TaxID=2939421 RepID=UPI002012A6BE|nr:putative zinc-binding metallopeptidase [Bacteroides sp. ET71]MCL1617543.1 putative zinc-binding metallopeptidase [Bacteroides sp. ET71]
MKQLIGIFIALATLSLWSCSEDDLDPNSIFGGTETGKVPNEFDTWLLENYTTPYNIEFKYRFEDMETDDTYNLVAADYDRSIALAKFTKYLWLESYEELLGPDFIRTYCPRLLFLVGSPAYNTDGSVVLGTAEGGLKITLYNVNSISLTSIDVEQLNYWYFKTMHHEFAHILHQTKNYPTEFNEITPSGYQPTGWVNVNEQQALDMGFVSPYASSETQEDFVEIIAIYVTNTPEYWDNMLSRASEEGRGYINQKLEIVKNYMTTTWGIDLDALRDIVQRRSQEVAQWDVNDLTTLD